MVGLLTDIQILIQETQCLLIHCIFTWDYFFQGKVRILLLTDDEETYFSSFKCLSCPYSISTAI